MDFNFKGVRPSGWISLALVVVLMILAIIFKPEFSTTTVYAIAGGIIGIIVFVLLYITGVFKKKQ